MALDQFLRLPIEGSGKRLRHHSVLRGGLDLLMQHVVGTDYVKQMVHEERAFLSGGAAQTNVTSPNASMTIVNPTGSGRRVILVGWEVFADATATIAYYRDAVSTGALQVVENAFLASAAARVGECRVGVGVLTGGVMLAGQERVMGNFPIIQNDRKIVIPPGRTFSIRFLGPGATNNVWFTSRWFEEDLPA